MSKTHKNKDKEVKEMTPEERLNELQKKLQKAENINADLHSQMEGAKILLKTKDSGHVAELKRLLIIEEQYKSLKQRYDTGLFNLKQRTKSLLKSRDEAVTKAAQLQGELSNATRGPKEELAAAKQDIKALKRTIEGMCLQLEALRSEKKDERHPLDPERIKAEVNEG